MTTHPADAVREAPTELEQMRRFRFYEGYAWDSGADLGGMDEEPDGEWVRYSDVQAVLAALAGADDERYRAGYAAGVADVKRSPYYDDSADTKPAALAGAAPGFALAPWMPTQAMFKAAEDAGVSFATQQKCWNAMLGAAPVPHAPAKAREDVVIEVRPVIVADAPDAHAVRLSVGVQQFHVGPDYLDTKAEADWLAGQLSIAVCNIGGSR